MSHDLMYRRRQLQGLGLLPQQKLFIGVGAVALLAFIFSRKSVRQAVSTAVGDAERLILKSFVKGGQESYIDASFAIGEREGISPYMLMGFLLVESGFGRALTKGEAFGREVYTGDFIPRPVTATNAVLGTMPGVKKAYWERPQIGNLKAYKGEMWVPAHDLRIAQAGGDVKKAYTYNGGVARGVGWGWTPWQLDWGSFSSQLKAGAGWEPEKATAEAVKLIKSNIAVLKKGGLTGAQLVRGVIAAYNAGAGRVLTAFKSNVDLTTITAKSGYIDIVTSIANRVGKAINL